MHNNVNGSFNIDNLVERGNRVLYNAAERSGNAINLVDQINVDGVARKLWFNNKCKMLRKEYHRSKNHNRRKNS